MSSESSNTPILAENLLTDRALLIIGSDKQRIPVIESTCVAHGATISDNSLDTFVVDLGGFAGGADDLARSLELLWAETRRVVNEQLIPSQHGQVILIGPTPSSGEFASSLRAALENLARTLSIEWSQYGIRTVAILPADETTAERVAQVVAYLSSHAGEYFSGCKLELVR